MVPSPSLPPERGRAFSSIALLLGAAAAVLILTPPAIYPQSRVLASAFIVLAAFLPGRSGSDAGGLASAVLPWLLAALAGAALSSDPGRGLAPAMDLCGAGLAGWVAANRLGQAGKTRLLAWLSALGAVAVGLALVQAFGGLEEMRTSSGLMETVPDPRFQRDLGRRLSEGRPFGPFLLPGILGCFCGMLFFSALESRRLESRSSWRLGWTFAAPLFLGGLVLSRSVSGWAAFVATAAALSFQRGGRERWLGLAAGGAGLYGVLAWRGLPSVHKESVLERWGLWRDSAHLAWQSRLIGVGPGRLGEALLESGSSHFARHAHSLPLELLAELGILGIAVFLWLAWKTFSAFRAGGLGPALFFGLIQACVDLSFQQGEILFVFFFLWGLSASPVVAPDSRTQPRPKVVSLPGPGSGPVLRESPAFLLAALAASAVLVFPDPRHMVFAALAASLGAVLVLLRSRPAEILAPGRILVILLAWALLSAWAKGTAGAGALGLGMGGAALAVLAASATALAHPPGRNYLGWAAGISSALLGSWSAMDWLLRGFPRGLGPYSNPNLLAGALLPGVFFLGASVAGPQGGRRRLLAASLLFPSLVGLAASGSWAAAACAAVVAAVSLWMGTRRSPLGALGVIAAFAGAILWVPSFSRLGDKFSSMRSMIWRAALEASVGEPWFGAGPGQGGWLLLARTPDDRAGPFRYDHWAMDPHSGLLRLGLEAGFPALALGFGFILILFLMRFRGALRGMTDPGLRGLSLGVLALCAFAVLEDVFLSPGALILGAAVLGSCLGSLSEEKGVPAGGGDGASYWLRAIGMVLACSGPGLARLGPSKSAGQPADPSSPLLWAELADARTRLYLSGRSTDPHRAIQSALDDYERAGKLAPLDPYIRLHQARLLAAATVRKGLPRESLPGVWNKFEEAIALSPRVALLPWEAAQAAMALGDLRRTQDWLATAGAIEPNFVAPRRILVKLNERHPEGARFVDDLARAEASLAGYTPENDYCRALVEADGRPGL